jgi:hypothetical protein
MSRETSYDTRATANVLRHVGDRYKNSSGIGSTHGEWAGVTTLEAHKSRGYAPPRRPAGIRKPNKVRS